MWENGPAIRQRRCRPALVPTRALLLLEVQSVRLAPGSSRTRWILSPEAAGALLTGRNALVITTPEGVLGCCLCLFVVREATRHFFADHPVLLSLLLSVPAVCVCVSRQEGVHACLGIFAIGSLGRDLIDQTWWRALI